MRRKKMEVLRSSTLLWFLALSIVTQATYSQGSSRYLYSQAAPSHLSSGQRWPDSSERDACRPIRDRIGRTSPRFNDELRRSSNSRVYYQCSDCRYMSQRCEDRLDALVNLVRNEFPYGRILQVQRAWTNQEIQGQNQSLHYEGRSLQLRLQGGSNYDHRLLAGLCIEAGFDWVQNNGYTVKASVIPTSCNTPLDLAFALDSSGSVGSYHFGTQLTFINNMVDFFDISLSDTRVALIRFATGVNLLSRLTQHYTKSSLKYRVSRVGYTGGYTAIGPALATAEEGVFRTGVGARPLSQGIPRVLILMTDGKSNVGVSPEIPADRLKASGVNIFVIGVGGGLRINELQEISSKPLRDHLYELENFDDYAALVNRMRAVSCDEPADVPPGHNTTTEVPEDGWKYFQAKCDGLSGNVIISIHDIVGKTNIYASATIKNPNPWDDPRLVKRDTSTGRIKSVAVQLPNTGDATVYIAIKGIDKVNRFTIVISNDLFGSPEFQVSLEEERGANTPVTTLQARPRHGFSVQYSIFGDSSDLTINRYTGQVQTLRRFDRETETSVRATIMATDQRLPCYTGVTELVVNLIDVNDNSPILTPNQFQTEIDDTSVAGLAIVTFTATDRDIGKNALITFIVSGPNSADFSIDSSGILRLATQQLSSRNIPSYRLVVTARDAGSPSRSDSSIVTVNIRRTNRAPQFLLECARMQSFCRFVVRENRDISLNFSAVDDDSGVNGLLSYSISPVSSSRAFTINSLTGIVTNDRDLDFEQADFYEFDVKVRDTALSPLSATARITVTIEDENEFTPTITSCSGSVLENEIGMEVVRIHAEDPDPFAGLLYSLVSGDNIFAVSRLGGLVTTRVSLDRENISSYNVTVMVRDSGISPQLSSSRSCTIRVLDANDNTPVIIGGPFEVTLSEGTAIGSTVTSIIATDADEGVNAEITYLLEGGSDVFVINSTTGVITTRRALDREVENMYTLTVIARDNGTPSLASETTVKVNVTDVNDNQCVFVGGPFTASIPERSPAGVVLSEVLAVDFDLGPNAVVRYRITSTGVASNIFGINKTSGVLSTARMVPSLTPMGSSPDFSVGGDAVYVLSIEGFDQGTPSLTCNTTLTIHIIDVRERGIVVNSTFQEVVVVENSPIGTPVAEFVPTEAREFQRPLSYTITLGNGLGHFAVNSTSGVVLVNGPLDRETKDSYSLFLDISDSSSPPLSLAVTLFVTIGDANDHVPTFSSPFYVGGIDENEAAGQSIVKLTATDGDIGPNAYLSYQIVLGDGDDLFYVENVTAIIRNRMPLDRENSSSHTIKVRVSDHGVPSLSSTTIVQVNVFDVNDNAPKFLPLPSNITVSEDVSVPLELLRFRARDADQGTNGNILYSLVPSTDSNVFSIDSLRGTLTLVASLDRDVQEQYTVTVTARDEAQPPLSTNYTLVVLVGDTNDNSPVFQNVPLSATVKENDAGNGVVFTAVATDADSGVNGAVLYSFLAAAPGIPFIIDGATGAVRLTRAVDYETQTSFELTVHACDQGIPQRCVSSPLTIAVQNVNEFRPNFLGMPFFPEVSESAGIGFTVLTLSAEDDDAVDTLRFTIVSGNNGKTFAINETSGVITLAKAVDFETEAGYELIVVALDSGNLTSMAVVTVTVLDVNDNAPVFEGLPLEVFITDETADKVVQLSATDSDSGLNGVVNYTLLEAIFINATHRSLILQAHDNGSPQLTTNVTILFKTLFSCENIEFYVDSTTGVVTFKTLCEILFTVYEPENVTYGSLLAGENITFLCVTRSNDPDNVYYTLLKDGSTGVEPSKGGVVTWTLDNVQRADEGYYHCEARLSGAGRLQSDRIALDIIEPPVLVDQPETVNTETGMMANFTCQARGDPEPKYSWLRNGEEIPLSDPIFSGANTSMLTVVEVALIDYGNIRCVASNKLGRVVSRAVQLVSYIVSEQITFVAQVQARSGQRCPQFSFDQFQYAIKRATDLDTVATKIRSSISCDEDPCWPQPCTNGGFCSSQGKRFTCACPAGWVGQRCEIDRNECERNPCQNGGTCENMEGTYRCLCGNGTAGQRCHLKAGACDQVDCGNSSKCFLTDITSRGYACVEKSAFVHVRLRIRAGRLPAAADVQEQLTPLVLNALSKRPAKNVQAGSASKSSSSDSDDDGAKSRARRQSSSDNSIGGDSFALCEVLVINVPTSDLSSEQEFEVTFVIICPDGQEAPEAGDTQFVCEDISGSADVAECSSGNMTFAPQKNSTDLASVQLQLLILSNGTTIPVSAEEGLQLLSDSGIEAALVPFGYSVVHFQAGLLESSSPSTATTTRTPDVRAVISDARDWLIVGVTVGTVMVVVLLIGLWMACCWRRRESSQGDESYDGVTYKHGSDIGNPTMVKRLSAVDTIRNRSVTNLNTSTIFSNEAAMTDSGYDLNDSTSSRQSRRTQQSTVTLETHAMDGVDLEKLHSTAGFMVTMPSFEKSHVQATPYSESPVEGRQVPGNCQVVGDLPRYGTKPIKKTSDMPAAMQFDTTSQTYEPMDPVTPPGYKAHTLPGRSDRLPVRSQSPPPLSRKIPVTNSKSGVTVATVDSNGSESVEALLAELNATLKHAHDSSRIHDSNGHLNESPCHHREIHARVSSDYFYDALGDDDYAYDTLHDNMNSGKPPPPLPPRNDEDESRSQSLPRSARLATLQDNRNRVLDRAGSREQLMDCNGDDEFQQQCNGSVNYMTPI